MRIAALREDVRGTTSLRRGPGIRWRGRVGAVVLACGVVLGLSGVAGPSASGAVMVEAGQDRLRGAHEAVADQYAADALLSFVLGLIRAAPEPSPRVYERVALGVGAVLSLTPDDAEVVRLEMQAWDGAGDLDRATEAAERLLRLDSRDTVAQLRVLNARIRRLPDADARLSVYDRILRAGSQGRGGIPEEVRSRMALDAALLAREVDADEMRFLDYLTTATSLDVTNKQASALFAAYFLDRTDDPGERVDLLTNLMLADPLDPVSQQALAAELLRHGAFAGAKRWFALTQRTRAVSGRENDEDLAFNYYLCVWNDDGPLAVRELFQSLRRGVLQEMARQRARLEAQGEDPGPELPPILPYRIELLSLGIDIALRDAPRIEGAVRRLEIWAALTRERLRASGRQMEAEAEDEQRRATIATAMRNAEASLDVELMYAYLLSGLELDKAEGLLDALVAMRGELAERGMDVPESERLAAVLDERAERRFRGWIAAHRGQTDEALELLRPLADAGDAGARLALGALAERRRLNEEAQLHYARIVQDDPSTMLTAIALTRLENMLGRSVGATRTQASLNESALSVAPWLEASIMEPRLISALSARFMAPTIGPLGRPVVEIRLRNAGRVPLGVGEDRPIDSSLMLLPRLSVPGLPSEQQAAVGRLVAPEVVSGARRLRLRPNEEIVIRANVGRGLTGRTVRQLGGYPASLTMRVLQNFTLGSDGSFSEGPLSSSAQTDILTRTAVDLRESAEVLADRLRFAEGESLLLDMHAAFFRLSTISAMEGGEEPLPAAQQRERDVLRGALAERAPRLSVSEGRLAASLALQLLPLRDDWGAALRDELSGLDDPMIDLLLIIASRAERDDPAFVRLAGRSDAIGAFAETLRSMRRLPTPDEEAEEGDAIDGLLPGASGP